MSGGSDEEPVRIGVSSCLLGNAVRYDGGHKRSACVTETFGARVQYVPVCPEVELGMGIPREAVRLVRRRDGIHMVGEQSGRDHTRAMRSWARRRVAELERLGLCGYILKKDSPSCGIERVRVYGAKGPPARTGRGLFADELFARLASLPVEEEDRLEDTRLRANFVERALAYRRLRALFCGRWSVRQLVEFHARHEPQLLAHSPAGHRALGRLVARARTMQRSALRERYAAGFMDALRDA